MTEPRSRVIRDRTVVLLILGVVVAVLVLNVLSASVPGVDQFLAVTPAILIVMVAVTVLLLLRTARRR